MVPGSVATPPTFTPSMSPDGSGTMPVLNAILIELRVLNEQFRSQLGTQASDLQQMRADEQWNTDPTKGTL
jgi:hypothetical protein